MEVDRPGPGEELNTGAATTPRDAATVIVLRGGAKTLEVLLVKRNPEQRFMGGAWVFPGGAVDPDGGIPPGTPFEDIPSDWFCPVCGARKADFSLYDD